MESEILKDYLITVGFYQNDKLIFTKQYKTDGSSSGDVTDYAYETLIPNIYKGKVFVPYSFGKTIKLEKVEEKK